MNDRIICPWCMRVVFCGQEFEIDDGEYTCEECDGEFAVKSYITRSITTTKVTEEDRNYLDKPPPEL